MGRAAPLEEGHSWTQECRHITLAGERSAPGSFDCPLPRSPSFGWDLLGPHRVLPREGGWFPWCCSCRLLFAPPGVGEGFGKLTPESSCFLAEEGLSG